MGGEMPNTCALPSLDRFVEYRASRDRALRDALVEAHLPLAHHLARRFEQRGEPLDDLVQVASFALVKAVERFEPDRGWAFTTFAVPTIVGELKRHFRDKGWSIRIPRRLQELHLRLGETVRDLTQELGHSPSVPEIARRLDANPEDVLEAMEAGAVYRAASLDAALTATTTAPVVVRAIGEVDRRLVDAEDQLVVRNLLATLPERERHIVTLRFFAGLTQSEIAARVGVSQMQVSRLLAGSLSKLRERSDEPELAAS
jgi:RNA polymerase sigma-B factor